MALSIRLVSARSISCRSPSSSSRPGGGPSSVTGGRCGQQLELLHRVGHQLVQAEALAVQHLVGGLQRGQFEQLLRQPAHLVALRQRRRAAGALRALLVGAPASLPPSASRWPCSAVSGVRRSCATLAIISRCAAGLALLRGRPAPRCADHLVEGVDRGRTSSPGSARGCAARLRPRPQVAAVAVAHAVRAGAAAAASAGRHSEQRPGPAVHEKTPAPPASGQRGALATTRCRRRASPATCCAHAAVEHDVQVARRPRIARRAAGTSRR